MGWRRSQVLIGLAGLIGAVAAPAGAEPPRGRRTRPVAPTHVVIVEADLAAPGLVATLRPGAAVAVAGALPRSGPVTVTTAGPVKLTGTVPVAALGLRVAADAELRVGGQVVGVAYAGALVRPLGEARDGRRAVQTTGALAATGELAADALTAAPRAFVYRTPPAPRLVAALREVALFARPASVGTTTAPLATLAPRGEAALLEQRGALARVRVFGPVEVEGWALAKHFTEELDRSADAGLLAPTHEVLAGCALYPAPGARRPAGRLAGGTLLEVNGRAGGRLKVTTVSDVIAGGYVAEADVRPLVSDPEPSL